MDTITEKSFGSANAYLDDVENWEGDEEYADKTSIVKRTYKYTHRKISKKYNKSVKSQQKLAIQSNEPVGNGMIIGDTIS